MTRKPYHHPCNEINDILPQLGVRSFRGIQEDVVRSVMEGRDTLALAATGAGKTLCYQASSLLRPSWTLICSPLIALMDDQINSCQKRGLEAFSLRGDMEKEDRQAILQKVIEKQGILFVSPEIINAPRSILREAIIATPPGLAVFDEAHCISAWGQGFRPDYATVGRTLTQLGRLKGDGKPAFPILAMTATATEEIIEDIRSSLSLQKAAIIKGQTYRDSISFEVQTVPLTSEEAIESMFPHILNDLIWFGPKKNGVIYCRRKKDVDWLYEALKNTHSISKHHSGLSATERQSHSQRFLDGHSSIMIATIGFGMGLDRGDIDFVIHAGPASSPEEWTQEAGRGGRDGRHSWSITYLTPGFSRNIRSAFINRAKGYGMARIYVRQLLGMDKRCHNAFLRTWNSGPAEGATPSPCCDQCDHPKTTPAEAHTEAVRDALLKIGQSPSAKPPTDFLQDVLFAYGLIDYEDASYGGFKQTTLHLSYRGRQFLLEQTASLKITYPDILTQPENRQAIFAVRIWREGIEEKDFINATSKIFETQAEKLLSDDLFENYYGRTKTSSVKDKKTQRKNSVTLNLSL